MCLLWYRVQAHCYRDWKFFHLKHDEFVITMAWIDANRKLITQTQVFHLWRFQNIPEIWTFLSASKLRLDLCRFSSHIAQLSQWTDGRTLRANYNRSGKIIMRNNGNNNNNSFAVAHILDQTSASSLTDGDARRFRTLRRVNATFLTTIIPFMYLSKSNII